MHLKLSGLRRIGVLIGASSLVLGMVAPVAADEPTPVGSVTVESAADYDPQTNEIIVHGTVTCVAQGTVEIAVDAMQTIGQATVMGFGFASVFCAGSESGTLAWAAPVGPFASPFNPGSAELLVHVAECTLGGCLESEVTQTVDARPVNNRPPPPPAPGNDERGGATPIFPAVPVIGFDTSNATSNETDATCPTVLPFVGHTVWYSFTAPEHMGVIVSTAGSLFDTTLHVLAPDGTVIACNDDVVAGEVRSSNLVFEAQAGQTYLIQVGSWELSPGGWLNLTVTKAESIPDAPTPPPANDHKNTPTALPLGSTLPPLDTSAATSTASEDPVEGDCDMPLHGATVWYTLMTLDAGWVTVNTLGSDYDTTLFVYSGTEIIACNDQAQGGNQSELFFEATEAATYLVMVGSWNGAPGGSLVISAAPSTPPFVVDLTIDPVGRVSSGSGNATLTGTVSCTYAGSGTFFLGLEQVGGRFTASGGTEVQIASCGPEGGTWTATVPAPGPKYQAGQAFAFVDMAFTSGAGETFFSFTQALITLQPAGSHR